MHSLLSKLLYNTVPLYRKHVSKKRNKKRLALECYLLVSEKTRNVGIEATSQDLLGPYQQLLIQSYFVKFVVCKRFFVFDVVPIKCEHSKENYNNWDIGGYELIKNRKINCNSQNFYSEFQCIHSFSNVKINLVSPKHSPFTLHNLNCLRSFSSYKLKIILKYEDELGIPTSST